jgi:drug/metabolite transporter (DMT)-like permease
MNPSIAIIAAIGCSICNGISTVQQKIGADKEPNVKTLDATLLLRLLRNGPYMFGTVLELAGYGLSLVALRILPLFLVQSVIAASVVVTAVGDRLILHTKISHRNIFAIIIVLIGLVFLSISAEPSRAVMGSSSVRLLLELSPILIGVIGIVFIYIRNNISAMVLAALAGLSFGTTSTIGRIIVYPHPLWRLGESPLTWGLIASALLGQYLFTLALQRTTATKGNATMIALQTLGPALCGLIFFNDKIRSGYELIVVLGAALVIIGCIMTAVEQAPLATI